MNSYPEYTEFFKNVAKKLTLLGQKEGAVNLCFIDSPEQADVLLVNLQRNISYPVLLVEFYDEDPDDQNGKISQLSGAFAVMAPSGESIRGKENREKIIYETCKPAADQILAFMQKLSDERKFKVDGKSATVLSAAKGLWVGPLKNNLYGWRYEFTWRINASVCYNADAWKS